MPVADIPNTPVVHTRSEFSSSTPLPMEGITSTDYIVWNFDSKYELSRHIDVGLLLMGIVQLPPGGLNRHASEIVPDEQLSLVPAHLVRILEPGDPLVLEWDEDEYRAYMAVRHQLETDHANS